MTSFKHNFVNNKKVIVIKAAERKSLIAAFNLLPCDRLQRYIPQNIDVDVTKPGSMKLYRVRNNRKRAAQDFNVFWPTRPESDFVWISSDQDMRGHENFFKLCSTKAVFIEAAFYQRNITFVQAIYFKDKKQFESRATSWSNLFRETSPGEICDFY